MGNLPLAWLLAAVLALAVLASLINRSQNAKQKRPPIFEGTPLVGGILKFLKGPMNLMRDGYSTHGEVFTVPVLHKRITFLLGPQVTTHFFKAPDEEMSQTEVYQFNVPTFGPGVVYDVDAKVRAEQIRFFAEALKISNMRGYIPQFLMEAEEFFNKWESEGVVDLKSALSELTVKTASRTLLGREIRESMFDKVSDLIHDLDSGMMPISVFFPYLPIPAHNARDRARKELAGIFSKVIQGRRAAGRSEHDLLQHFMDSRYKVAYGGRATNDEEISGMLIASLFAGQHTSSITSAWTGYFMLADKARSWRAAVEEQQRLLAQYGPELSMDVLSDMPVLHACITEALRMYPPLIMLLRLAKTTFSVTDSNGKTFVIPKGDITATSPGFQHRLPTLFDQPDSFQPDRFQSPRDEDKKRPFTFIGFGGGRHGCLGTNFAYLQIKTIWSTILRNFDLQLVDPVPGPDYNSMVVGPLPCRIRFQRQKLS